MGTQRAPPRSKEQQPPHNQQQKQQQHGLTDFELQRQARIKRNRQVLCDLGLENAGQQLLGAAPPPKRQKKQPAPKEQQELEPTRKSRRQRGDKPELDVLGSRGRRCAAVVWGDAAAYTAPQIKPNGLR